MRKWTQTFKDIKRQHGGGKLMRKVWETTVKTEIGKRNETCD